MTHQKMILIFSIFVFFTSKGIAQTQIVEVGSLVPNGWVTTDNTNIVSTGKYTIQKIDKMPSGATVVVCTGSLVPNGWVTIDNSNIVTTGRYTIKKIDGLPSGTVIAICIGSLVPNGWISIDNPGSSGKYSIKKL